MIESFKDEETEKVFSRVRSRKFPTDIQRMGRIKLTVLNEAVTLADLSNTPGNRFKKLDGDRTGQYSIRINRQWRICFNWTTAANSAAVEITDYH